MLPVLFILVAAAVLIAAYGIYSMMDMLEIAAAIIVSTCIYMYLEKNPDTKDSTFSNILLAVIFGYIAFAIFAKTMFLVPLVVIVLLTPSVIRNIDTIMSLITFMNGRKKGKKGRR